MRIEGGSNTFSTQSLNSNDMNVNNDAVNGINKGLSSQKNQQKSTQENNLSNIKLSKKSIQKAVENTNEKLVATDRKFEFSVNEETNDIIVRVINKDTDEVIREIPSEKILDMVAKMMELAGLFVDERR